MSARMAGYLSLAVLVFQNSMLALMMRLSRTTDGDMYYASSAVVICEVLKLLVSLHFLSKEFPTLGLGEVLHQKVYADPRDVARLLVPAGLYTVQNNLAYFAMSHLDAATYQLLYQLKILTTAVFSVVLLGKQLAPRQWASLCVLCLGVGLVQASAISDSSSSNSLGSTDATAAEETKRSNSLLGLLAVAAACCSSGLAGVYFEMVLKNAKTSLWVRNCQLSVFGAILGLLPVAKDWSAMYGPGGQGFLHGYNHIVWCVVLLQAGGGLLVALVVKYADSILKGFATSLSIVISCIASYFLFDFVVTPRFVLGGSLVLYSVYVYGSSDAGSRSSQTSAAPTNGSSTGSGSSSSNSSNGSSSFDKGIEVAPSPTSMDSDYNNNSNSNSSHSAESQHGSLLQRPVSTQQVSNVSSRTRAPSKDYDKGT